MNVQVRGIYDRPTSSDGTRVLVDRIWPRGVTKDKARVDDWNKDVAPSARLRRWYRHDPAKFDRFRDRYRNELSTAAGQGALQTLRQCARGTRLTLVTATKDVQHSQAAVLAELLGGG
ncbi:MAG TPA: DUF488 family protein [Mycobacterium sp.]|nr:DUF488 family protein [Mycobacterium sp.]